MIAARRDLAELMNYGAEELLDDGIRIRMHRNEPPLPAPAHVLEALRRITGEELRTYPTAVAAHTRDLLAERLGVEPQNVLLTAGADDALAAVTRAYGGPNRTVVAPSPSFGMYERVAAVAGAAFVRIPYRTRWTIDLEEIAAACTGPSVAILGHPNNPTGEPLAERDASWLASALPQTAIVLDEVYLALSEASLVHLAMRRENVIVVGSLSKTASLAGLRIGYAVAAAPTIQTLRSVLQPFPVGAPSLIAARAYLEQREQTRAFEAALRAIIRQSLDGIQAAAAPLSDGVWRGPANFVLIDAGKRRDAVLERMRERAIGVRSYRDPALQTCLRVCAAPIPQTEEFINAYRTAAA